MMKSRVSVRLRALGIAVGAMCALMGFNESASANAELLAISFEKPEARAKATQKAYRASSTGRKHQASKPSYRGKYAKSSRKHNRVARSGAGNRGALMATLVAVKPAGLPLSLAAAVITQESGWRVNARGSSGEIGLMQLMPATARQYGGSGNLYNPANNMRVGTRVLHACYKRAGGNVAATIGCYNRGPGLMWSWGGRSITRRYVSNVHRYMSRS